MSNNKEWFESWFDTPYYKYLYNNRTEEEAAAFVSNILDYLKPQSHDKFLDIGCGYGRVSRQIAKSGYYTIGIDISETRIDVARKYSLDNTAFYVQDMRNVFRTNYFDFVINFFTSFGYFEQKKDNQLAANAFVKSLKDNGTLVIDYLNPIYTEANLVAHNIVNEKGFDFDIRRKVENDMIIKTIEFIDEFGIKRKYFEKVQLLMLSDFKQLFEPLGMELMDVFGDYELNPYNETDSQRMIMIFKNKKWNNAY